MKDRDIVSMPAASRCRLIGELATRVKSDQLTPQAREEALSLIGRLARRASDEPPDRTCQRRKA